ncbi:MAG: tRNA (adenosine(37)-N6)-threonylcarbamoyltransferase complex ATPase subunit type 1 TsaE [Desulfotomaculaceae bacterium]|nr:tRNA (adenosine(37)-N6)-threonylcarbamoyltransferase complex ATPase subunit type 1 TsaE [Desulfotomaculaceae bacterium]
MVVIKTSSAAETGMLGEKLGSLLGVGALICLYGGLGAGKTCFAQGVARGLGIEDTVTSPTFTLINEYYDRSRLPFFHMDVYRLDSIAEMEDLGYEEYFYDGGVTLVEWAEKIGELLPEDRLDISIDRTAGEGEDLRQITLLPRGEKFQLLIKELMAVVCPGD